MKLAIGDVVRDRNDMALGTFAGIARHGAERRVTVQLPGGSFRLVSPGAVVLVARPARPTTIGRGVVALLFLVGALVAAFLGGRSAEHLGADRLVIFLCGLGAYSAVMAAYQWWLRFTSPRRFRV
ncbi:hypothetical protein [Streptomyces griseocarneus]|uniref:hypothetical protein n=1 Tax=Streptomyces griseocarneus TaxID=51201 RepID=UPI00167D3DCB|nr:hypothetical protein [Streptomyces griseocarneus]MBZ6473211.1 hypothetical protein [Streptomyces griseocarneus]GHG60468.1 hypothetical protein GCM10018779_27810 [Streptomyces griseocarneus]